MSTSAGIAPTAPAAISPQRVLAASVVGNVLEWYDFAVYGFLAVAIGKAFFPSGDPVASVLAAFGAFAAGYVARPIGGILFGHVGDRLGRKRALTLSVALMAVPTVLIGLLPTHAQIGAAAPALLVLLRVVQGLSVGGEFTTSIVYIVERAEPGRRGLHGSLAMVAATFGILLGSAVAALITSWLDAAALAAWGWRVPFLLGMVVGIAGVWLRRRLPETPVGAGRPQGLPLLTALRRDGGVILRAMGWCLGAGPVFYILFVYIVSYLEGIVHVPARTALDINTASMVVLCLLLVAGGALSDRFGRKPVALMSMGALLLLAWPLFRLLDHAEPAMLLGAQLAFAVLLGLYNGRLPAMLVEALPGDVRCSAVALSYNVSVGLFGGFAPLVATWLIHRTGDEMMPALILIVVAAVILVSVWRSPETRGISLR